jgi:hypothetical protein
MTNNSAAIQSTDPEEDVVVGVEDSSEEDENNKKKRDVLSHEADEYPMRQFSFPLMGSEVYLNPFTSIFGFFFLWAISIWCMVEPDKSSEVRDFVNGM